MTNDQPSIGELQADLAYYRDRVHSLETAVTGARAVLAVADDAPRRLRAGVDPDAAASLLRALLDEAGRRPDAVETAHVRALDDILCAVLAHLEPVGS